MVAVERFQPEKHYEEICRWWKAQNWPAVPLSHLPATGLVVSHRGVPAAAGFIFKTDSAFCWLEFIVASPEIRHDDRSAALSVLISTARLMAETMGFQSIFMSIKNSSLGKRLEPHGFTATEQGMTNYACDLSRR